VKAIDKHAQVKRILKRLGSKNASALITRVKSMLASYKAGLKDPDPCNRRQLGQLVEQLINERTKEDPAYTFSFVYSVATLFYPRPVGRPKGTRLTAKQKLNLNKGMRAHWRKRNK